MQPSNSVNKLSFIFLNPWGSEQTIQQFQVNVTKDRKIDALEFEFWYSTQV